MRLKMLVLLASSLIFTINFDIVVANANANANTGIATETWTRTIPSVKEQKDSRQERLRATRSARAKQIYRVSKSRKIEESLLSCFMRCSKISLEPTLEPHVRTKRQIQNVITQIVDGWKMMQNRSKIILDDFCKAQEADEKTIQCFKNECQKSYPDHKLLQKVIDSLQALQNVSNEICPDKCPGKLNCLSNSKSAITNVISGQKCVDAAENFRLDGISRQPGGKTIISGQTLCELFYCPAEAARDISEDMCKEFVYDVVTKIGDLNYFGFAFGFEEAKIVLKEVLNSPVEAQNSGEKCGDLVSS